MRVLVTGASGFIGGHLTAWLRERGHRVVGLSRHGGSGSAGGSGAGPGGAGRGVGVTVSARGDVVTGAGLWEAARGADAVIHLVGVIRERRGATFEQVHVQGTRNAVEAARAAGAERFVHMSALGAAPGSRSGYLRSKAAAEAIVRDSGLAWTVLRPSLVFGPGDDFFGRVLADLVRRPPLIPQVGDGRFPFRPVWVGDVVRAFGGALERPATVGRTYEVVGPTEYTFRELLELVRGALGLRKPIVPVPLAVMHLSLPLFALLPEPPITRDQLLMLLAGNTGDPTEAQAAFDLPLEALPDHLAEVLGVVDSAP